MRVTIIMVGTRAYVQKSLVSVAYLHASAPQATSASFQDYYAPV